MKYLTNVGDIETKLKRADLRKKLNLLFT